MLPKVYLALSGNILSPLLWYYGYYGNQFVYKRSLSFYKFISPNLCYKRKESFSV